MENVERGHWHVSFSKSHSENTTLSPATRKENTSNSLIPIAARRLNGRIVRGNDRCGHCRSRSHGRSEWLDFTDGIAALAFVCRIIGIVFVIAAARRRAEIVVFDEVKDSSAKRQRSNPGEEQLEENLRLLRNGIRSILKKISIVFRLNETRIAVLFHQFDDVFLRFGKDFPETKRDALPNDRSSTDD